MSASNDIDTTQVIRYLSGAFARATQGMERAQRYKDKDTDKYVTTQLYDLQVEFCYMVNEITRGPKYFIPKIISDCNQLINQINATKQQ